MFSKLALPSGSSFRSVFFELFPIQLLVMVAAVCVFLLAGALYCFADDGTAVAAATTASGFSSILTTIDNYVEAVTVALACVAAIIGGGRIIVQIIGLLNITDANQKAALEAKMRDVLHNAVVNGLQFAFVKAKVPASLAPSPEVIANAITYVETKNPDVLAFFNLRSEELEHIAYAKLVEVLPWLKSYTSSDDTGSGDTTAVPAQPEAIQAAPAA